MTDCLSENTFAELLEGRLAAEERAAAEQHLSRCEVCREVLAKTTQAYLDETSPPTLREGQSPSSAPAAGSQLAFSPEGTSRFPLPRGAKLGRYVIIGGLGAGGMGVVYAAYDPELDRKIALKLLRPDVASPKKLADLRAWQLREAKAMARLSHRNVISVYDVGAYGDQVFIAMEFVDGRTFGEWLREQPRSWRQVLGVLREAGEGLEAAHGAGLVHRDFKPENVLVGWDGRVRVTDFGLARFVATTGLGAAPERAEGRAALPGKEPAGLTKTGALVGTPSYMSPEQIAGAPVDLRSDIFSFCVTLYEGLYGERPYAAQSLTELQAALETGEISEPPRSGAAPVWLRRVLLRGLRTDPGERYPTMAALLQELRRDDERARHEADLLPSAKARGVLVAVLSLISAAVLLTASQLEKRGLWVVTHAHALGALALWAAVSAAAVFVWRRTFLRNAANRQFALITIFSPCCYALIHLFCMYRGIPLESAVVLDFLVAGVGVAIIAAFRQWQFVFLCLELLAGGLLIALFPAYLFEIVTAVVLAAAAPIATVWIRVDKPA
jgi:hypothetical protein